MYIGTDNKTAGQVQGEAMREARGGSGKIGIITGGLGALNLNERIDGFRETVGPDIEIVEVVATDDDLQKGLGVSEALLRAHPDLNGVACVSATGGPTLAQVIQGQEFEGRDVTIVAFDDLEETVRAIEDGIITATLVQRPVQMGRLSISQSYEILTRSWGAVRRRTAGEEVRRRTFNGHAHGSNPHGSPANTRSRTDRQTVSWSSRAGQCLAGAAAR